MYAVLHPSNFFAQAAAHQRPELRKRPFVVLDGEPPTEMVFAANHAARSQGVEIGMTRLQAETFSEVVALRRVIEHEHTAHATLHHVACMFSPRIESVEERPGTYALDIRGMDLLYGDATELANKLRRSVMTAGFLANIAVAENFHAAVSLACGRTGVSIVPSGCEAHAIGQLPVAAPETIAELIAHYRLKELAEDSHSRKSFPTRAAYRSYLDNWVLPRWGTLKLDQIKPVAVEEWLDGIKRAKATRAKIRNLMSALYHHAMRYEWTDKNPIKLVRQSAKRERIPDVLELAELQLLLTKLDTRERTLVLLAAATGLRVSELLGIRWADIDFDNLELNVTRSIWHQKIGDCKTEASAKPVPLDGYMAEDLLQWRKKSPYPMHEDWVFASPTMKGEQHYWPDNLMKRYVKPVARANGIYKNIGWHTFRHTFGTLLKANGEDVKTVQELLRHANSRITLDVYTQAVGSNKRAAQSKVVRMMIPGVGQNAGEMDPQKARIGA